MDLKQTNVGSDVVRKAMADKIIRKKLKIC